MSDPSKRGIGILLSYLDLEALDSDLFLGDPGEGSGRLFGGMVAAQSVIAAGRCRGSSPRGKAGQIG